MEPIAQAHVPPTEPLPTPGAQVAALGPVSEPERIAALDVLRGVALLGIFMVNMPFFCLPFGEFLAPSVFDDAPRGEFRAWAFVKFFFEFKFISLFSLLFGVGLVVQMTRAQQRGRRFAPVYLRRLVVLAAIGLIHGILLWYGDILFLYACIGFILFLCRRIPPKIMLVIAGVILMVFVGLSLLGAIALSLMSGTGGAAAHVASAETIRASTTPAAETPVPQPRQSTPATLDQPAAEESWSQTRPAHDTQTMPAATATHPPDDEFTWSDEHPDLAAKYPWLAEMIESEFDLTGARWREAESDAYRNGPFIAATAFRVLTFGGGLVFAVFGFGWHVLAMFFIGAGLMKLGFFSSAHRRWHWRLLFLGVILGMPLDFANLWLSVFAHHHDRWDAATLAGAAHEIGSAAMCLGLVGGTTLVVHAGWFRPLLNALQCTGRMALTNYLLQTIIATSIMYWWGLGFFGEVSRPTQIVLVLAIYACQLLLSVIWLRIFTIGPAEWLWRSLTYLKAQPVIRR